MICFADPPDAGWNKSLAISISGLKILKISDQGHRIWQLEKIFIAVQSASNLLSVLTETEGAQ